MAVEHETPAVLLKSRRHRALQRLVVRAVPRLHQSAALVVRQRAPQRRQRRGDAVDRAHAPRGHRLRRVVGEALHVDHQAAHRRAHRDGVACISAEEPVRQVVRHADQLVAQVIVAGQELLAHVGRDRRGIVRDVQHHPRREALRGRMAHGVASSTVATAARSLG